MTKSNFSKFKDKWKSTWSEQNIFRKSEKYSWKYLAFVLVGEAMEKKLLETVISTKCVIILSFALKFFGISDGLSLTFNTDF